MAKKPANAKTVRWGRFVLTDLPAGTHEVVVSYVGLDERAVGIMFLLLLAAGILASTAVWLEKSRSRWPVPTGPALP